MAIQKTPGSSDKPVEPGHYLAALVLQTPKTKSGQVQFLWPQIKSALRQGHTIREVWESLSRDGLELSYSRLRYYVARLRRRDASCADIPVRQTRGADIAAAPEPRDHSISGDNDPAFNLRNRLNNRPGFHWDESPPDLKKLIGNKART